MQKTEPFRRIQNMVDAAMAALPVVDGGEDLREEFTEEYEALMRIDSTLRNLVVEVSMRDETGMDPWNNVLEKAAALTMLTSGPSGPCPGEEGVWNKTQAFMDLEKVVHSMRDISTEGVNGFCASMDAGNALLDLAEQISGRDKTDTDAWNELIHTIHTIAAGTDDIPDKDETGRDRQSKKESRRDDDEIIPVRSRHIKNTGRGCRKWRGLK